MDSIAAVSNHFKCVSISHLIRIQSARIVLHIQREMALHLDYCASFGLSKEEIEAHTETIGQYN